jgi:GTP-binding protein
MDLPDVQSRWKELEIGLKKKGITPLPISAATGSNLKALLYKAAELLRNAPEIISEPIMPIYHPRNDPRQYEIKRVANRWRISGESIERSAAMTYWESDESIRRFQRILETLGIDTDLRKAGIKEGDMVEIGDYELEWHD